MSTPTKSRRMPIAYRVRPGGITEIAYSATYQPVVAAEPMPEVRLPGTRWLDVRRAREQRLAAAAHADRDTRGLLCLPDVEPRAKHESWAARIANSARRLAQRRTASPLHEAGAELELSPQD